MTEEDKQKAIDLAAKLGLIVSFTNESGIYVTDGDSKRKIEWESVFPELNELR